MKYIHTKNNDFILFTEGFSHSEVASKFRLSKENIEGAGFIHGLDSEKISCVGESISLGITSSDRDTPLLQNHIRGY